MSGGISALSGVALLVCAAVLVLKSLGSSAAPIVISVGVIGIFSVAASGILDVFGDLSALAARSGITKYAEASMKILAVGYLASAVSEVTSELGAAAVGRALLVASRVEIALISMPFIHEAIGLGMELFSG